MDFVGHQFLAGAGLAENEHRGFGGRDQVNLADDPLYLHVAALPLFGVWSAQSGIARSYNWVNLGLSPVYVQRQLLLLALMGLVYVLGFAPTPSPLPSSASSRW